MTSVSTRPPLPHRLRAALRDAPRRAALPPLPAAAGEPPPRGGGRPPRARTALCRSPEGEEGAVGGGAEPGAPEQAAIAVCWLPPCLPRLGPGRGGRVASVSPLRGDTRGRGFGEMLAGPSSAPFETQGWVEGWWGGSLTAPLTLYCTTRWPARNAGRSLAPGASLPGPKQATGRAQGGQAREGGEAPSYLGDLATRGSRF